LAAFECAILNISFEGIIFVGEMHLSWFRLRFIVVLLLFSIQCSGLVSALPVNSSAYNADDFFRYEFIVNEEGEAYVKITYVSSLEEGFSWVLVPKFSKWLNRTVQGRIYRWVTEDTERYTGSQLYFYTALNFSFTEGPFEMVIEYNFSLAAMVVETESTYGIFYSPQIGFKPRSEFEAIVVFPERFRAVKDEALAYGSSGSYRADSRLSNSSHIFFRNIPSNENILRIQIGFRAIDGKADPITVGSGIFEFNTVARYREYAQKILDLYNATYDTLIYIFNTTLDHVTIRFFIPDYYSLTSIGGYIPFTGGKLGDIYVNIMFTRYVEGYLEIVALHELTHHFLWKSGISPGSLLWFHEGMAQYVSIKVAEGIGYEGARMVKEDMEKNVENIVQALRGNFGFLMEWTPSKAPRELGTLYAAAYYVVSKLAEEYGELDYYARLFKLLRNKRVDDTPALCYYLSLAANESIFDKFNRWGFNLPDIYIYWPLIVEVENSIKRIDPNNILLQPFRRAAEIIYRAVISGERIVAERTELYLLAALFIARFTPLIALFTYSSIIFAALTAALKLKRVF